jgi:hypothetical protein
MLCISVCGLGTGMGAMHPRFRYENIASVSMGLGGMAFMILSFGLVLLTLGMAAWVYHHSIIQPEPGPVGILKTGGGILLILLVNGCAFYLPLRKGAAALVKYEQ